MRDSKRTLCDCERCARGEKKRGEARGEERHSKAPLLLVHTVVSKLAGNSKTNGTSK